MMKKITKSNAEREINCSMLIAAKTHKIIQSIIVQVSIQGQ